MIVGERIKQLRERKKMSQGDLERLTGLLRCYTSRVENGHTVPAIETIQKYAKALRVEMWEFFAEDAANVKAVALAMEPPGKLGTREIRPFVSVIPQISPRDRKILLHLARAMRRRNAA